jgi:transposase
MKPGGLRIYLAVLPVDMRRSIDGLIVAVRERLAQDAAKERALWVFANGQRDRVKVLWRDLTGWCLLYKRLDKNRVVLPASIPDGAASVVVDAGTLAAILDGVARHRVRPTTRDIVNEAREKCRSAGQSRRRSDR